MHVMKAILGVVVLLGYVSRGGYGFPPISTKTLRWAPRLSSTSTGAAASTTPTSNPTAYEYTHANNILVLDHLNINHERGRHDLVLAFYIDALGCAVVSITC